MECTHTSTSDRRTQVHIQRLREELQNSIGSAIPSPAFEWLPCHYAATRAENDPRTKARLELEHLQIVLKGAEITKRDAETAIKSIQAKIRRYELGARGEAYVWVTDRGGIEDVVCDSDDEIRNEAGTIIRPAHDVGKEASFQETDHNFGNPKFQRKWDILTGEPVFNPKKPGGSLAVDQDDEEELPVSKVKMEVKTDDLIKQEETEVPMKEEDGEVVTKQEPVD